MPVHAPFPVYWTRVGHRGFTALKGTIPHGPQVRNASLDTRAARGRLGTRGKPYYFALDPGLHLGYRKLRGGTGKWVVRLYVGDQDYDTETIATADDHSDATFSDRDIVKAQIKDSDILTFSQAQAIARRLRDQRSSSGRPHRPLHRQ